MGNGKPVVLMADGQTTGGYPKVATVITADLPKLAQLKPGDKVHFQKTTLEQAHQVLWEFERKISAFESRPAHTETANSLQAYEVIVNGKHFRVSILKET